LESPEEKKTREQREEEEKKAKDEQQQSKAGKGGKQKDEQKKKGTEPAKPKEAAKPSASAIYVLPPEIPVGIALTEWARKANLDPQVPAGVTVEQELAQRTKEVRETLVAMEAKEPIITNLWNVTKEWSLSEFREIYHWLGCRFDHEFFESEMTEQSKKMVLDTYNKKTGVLTMDGGAVVANLSQYGLGFCVLLKSNGSSLYATKDLALAVRKFDEFKIDKSIYVVDVAQTLHFKQVFKTLELMGYEQAKKCYHLPYGLVVLPSGKMSSRSGNIKYFSSLKQSLYDTLYERYLKEHQQSGGWSQVEIDTALRACAVATIKYGMLNTDASNEIVYDQEKWTELKGNTGLYSLYAVTRIKNIVRDIPPHRDARVDYSLLTLPEERLILLHLNDFWQVVTDAASSYSAAPLCAYSYALASAFSSWYENKDASIKKEKDIHVQATRLSFISAVAAVLTQALSILGIDTIERM